MATTQNKIKLQYQTRIDFAGSSLTSSYQATTALTKPARIVKFANSTNRSVDISTDGTNDMDVVAASTGCVYDCSASHNTHEAVCFPAGTIFYVKAAAGAGSGTFSIVVLYT